MWVNRGSFGIRTQRTRPRQYRLSPTLTAADVGLSRLIWHTIAYKTPRRREKVNWLAPVNLFPPALRESGWGQAFSPPPHYLSATAYPSAYNLPFRAGIAALGYCDSLRCASVGPPFLFGRCYSLRPLCPPSTLIGWGQACGKPTALPHIIYRLPP